MKARTTIRTLLLTLTAVITLSNLTGCVVVPARGYYGGPVVVHAWVR